MQKNLPSKIVAASLMAALVWCSSQPAAAQGPEPLHVDPALILPQTSPESVIADLSPDDPLLAEKLSTIMASDHPCTNCLGPDLKLSPEQAKRILAKMKYGLEVEKRLNESDARLQAKIAQRGKAIDSNMPATPKIVPLVPIDPSQQIANASVLTDQATKQVSTFGNSTQDDSIPAKFARFFWLPEPEDGYYVNFCGPGAARVALGVRLSPEQLPSFDQLGHDLGVDPATGMDWQDIQLFPGVLNPALNLSGFIYEVNYSWDAASLRAKAVDDIDHNLATIFGVQTGQIAGWDHDTAHIMSVGGYWRDADGYWYLAVVDTASRAAGYSGSYYYGIRSLDLWNSARLNNFQIW